MLFPRSGDILSPYAEGIKFHSRVPCPRDTGFPTELTYASRSVLIPRCAVGMPFPKPQLVLSLALRPVG